MVVLPDCLADHIGSLVPGIERALNVSGFIQHTFFMDCQCCSFSSVHVFTIFFSLQDKSSTSNLKIEALVFTKLVLASHAPPVFHPYIKVGKH